MMTQTFPIGGQISAERLAHDPYPLFQQLLAHEPVSYVPPFKMWMVSRYDDVIEILRDAQSFTMEPPAGQINPMEALFGPMMLSLDGPVHKQIRDVFQEPFRPRHVRTFYTALINEIVDQLIAELETQQVVDLTTAFADRLAILTVVTTLGLDVNDIGTFRDWYDAFGAAIGNIEGDADVASAGTEAFQKFEALILAQIEALQLEPNSSVLSEIIHTPNNQINTGQINTGQINTGQINTGQINTGQINTGQINTGQIVSNCALTFFGGVETTTSMIANALWCLLTYPDAWNQIVNQPSLLENALEETMRYESAVQSAMRFPRQSMTLHGIEIQANEKIYCMLGAANRDPRVFAEPDRFNILRANANKHLSFAHGPHFCFGAPLARLEAITGIRKLMQRFPQMRLQTDHPTKPMGHEFRSPPNLIVDL